LLVTSKQRKRFIFPSDRRENFDRAFRVS
jgi:hypothetical protein